MNIQDKNIPFLRFPDFEGNWELTKLGEIAEVKRGAASQHLNYVNTAEEGIRLLRINDFLNDDAVYISDTEDIKRFRVKTNDILIAGTGATAGIVFIVPEKFNDLAFSYNAPRIRVNKANHSFILFYLKSDLILKQQKGLFVGNAQHFLDTDAMRGFKINLPTLPEQQKIAAFLTAVDEKIQQLTKKKDLLEQYKKGVMQKIFNQEIRFKDDNGNDFADWKEKKLGEVLFEPKQKAVENPNAIELLTVKLHCKGVIQTGNFPAVTKNARPYYKRFEDELLIGRQNFHNGGIGIVQKEQSGLICSNAISSYKVVKDNLKYIYYYITRPKYYKKAEDIMGGTGQKEISKNEFAKLKIDVPSFPEQQKIADFLSAIDDKINLTNKQLEKTKEYKKGLLQQMFI